MLGKIFGVSGSKVRQLYQQRFQAIKDKELPFLQQFEKQMQRYKRKNWGLRFLKAHEKAWLVNARTLRQQTGMSLVDRCQQFQKEFPAGHLNPTLLRRVYAYTRSRSEISAGTSSRRTRTRRRCASN